MGEDAQRSDAARVALSDWMYTRPGYTKWAMDLCRADDAVVRSHSEALELIEQEGMQGMQNIFLEEIALCYAVLGDEVQFRRWAKRVVKACAAEDPQVAQDFRKWLDEPKKFKKWGWREKQRKRTCCLISCCVYLDRDTNVYRVQRCRVGGRCLLLQYIVIHPLWNNSNTE